VVARYPGGDHSIFVGEVVALNTRSYGQPLPLLHYRSQYSRLYNSAVSQENASSLVAQ
jgi:flavin reductase (DIM6/NTAB) family NADH-FMN oxidoreductase RutF